MILSTIREGKIVPSQVTVQLILKEMESSDNCKFLIDGFPRSEENRKAFEQVVSFLFSCDLSNVTYLVHLLDLSARSS